MNLSKYKKCNINLLLVHGNVKHEFKVTGAVIFLSQFISQRVYISYTYNYEISLKYPILKYSITGPRNLQVKNQKVYSILFI